MDEGEPKASTNLYRPVSAMIGCDGVCHQVAPEMRVSSISGTKTSNTPALNSAGSGRSKTLPHR